LVIYKCKISYNKHKELRFILKIENKKIAYYTKQNGIDIEEILNDFSNYIYTISKNASSYLTDEDIEEIILDVVFTIWKNQNKLDVNKNMSPYIAGITKNLILKKYRNKKIIDNIDDYEKNLLTQKILN
jgi:DNA-directed RNA polymerase specialized sigma24 family protein